ncbi:hypothetical protein V2J09_018504 [Rumex salicifolius]
MQPSWRSSSSHPSRSSALLFDHVKACRLGLSSLHFLRATTYQNKAYGWVHVKNVVDAHIIALETQSANGRYCLVESVAHYKEIVGILHELYPFLSLPDKCADDKPLIPNYQVSKKRTESLRVGYVPVRDGLKDTVQSLKKKNFVTTPRKVQTEHFSQSAAQHRQRMSGTGKVVCVTGGSGFIASWLVKILLQRGYTVKASVRDPDDPRKSGHLLALDGAKERLHLFKANLLEDGSFDSGIAGCEGVFHTASPFYHDVKDPQVELIDPAVKGTLNVLGSVVRTSSVKRVVLTSSVAAVAYNGKPKGPDVVVDETWFSDPNFCREKNMWYVVSKTLAEEAAWKFAKEKGMDIVTINPAMVIGPLLQPTLNTSAAAVLNLINGATTYPNAALGWVHVKDVVEAHILALETQCANGRYCLVESVAHYKEVVRILRELYPQLPLPDKCADDNTLVPNYQVSKEKTESLGVRYIPLKDGLKDTVESLKEKNPRQFFPNPSKTYLINHSPLTQIAVRSKRVNNTARCEERNGTGKLVCVTGASGFVASWLVKTLLQRGYHVNATYRDDRSKCKHLEDLGGAKERLHLFKADLLEDGSFDSCVAGCEGVFHTASPFLNVVNDPEEDLIKPAVDGTLNVLGSVARTSSVKRVVLTSSIAAVNYNYILKVPDVVVDETWFSDQNFCTEYKKWYALSKTRAEEKAWSFAKEKGIDMVTINPATILGPFLQPKVNTSVEDVVEAHILALETQTANGRYCVVESVAHCKEIVGILRELYPHLLLPDKCADEEPLKPIYQVSKKRTKSLGVQTYIPLKDALKDTVESLIDKKTLPNFDARQNLAFGCSLMFSERQTLANPHPTKNGKNDDLVAGDIGGGDGGRGNGAVEAAAASGRGGKGGDEGGKGRSKTTMATQALAAMTEEAALVTATTTMATLVAEAATLVQAALSGVGQGRGRGRAEVTEGAGGETLVDEATGSSG